MHDPDYRTSQKDFNSFLQALTQTVVEADDTVPELPVRDIVSHGIIIANPRLFYLDNKLELVTAG